MDIRAEAGDFGLHVAFQTHSGEVLALFGPSGAGKSLTLRCLAGLVRPLAGRITLNGRALFDAARGLHAPPRLRRMGYVPQNYALFPHLTVAENIAYGLAGRSQAVRRARVADMVYLMRLEGLEARRPSRLSGGQQQRVALARALVTEPQALLLDEPFAALDGLTRGRLQDELISLQRRCCLPTVLVTHDLAEAYALSDRLAVFDAGRVLQVGPKEEVLRQPATHAVARFIGTRNIFEGQVVEAGSDGAVIAWAGHVIHTPAGGLQAGQRARFCIRPEEIKVVRPDQPLRPILRDNLLHGRLARAIDRGAMHTLFFKGEGASARDYDLEILLPHPSWQRLGLAVGQAMTVSLKKSAIHVLQT
ncbi:MAG: ABC transporter ATP-binding protein [Delftia sp.]|nr:ABC transporter ATP-binding protein [Delftia sp.]